MGRPRKPQTNREYLALDLKTIIDDNHAHTEMIRNTLPHCVEDKVILRFVREYFHRMIDLRKKMEYCLEYLNTIGEQVQVMLPDGTIRSATANERMKALIKQCELRSERYDKEDTLYNDDVIESSEND